MSNFKLGDKVKFIKEHKTSSGYLVFSKGDMGIIHEIKDTGYLIFVNKSRPFFYGSDINKWFIPYNNKKKIG